MATRRAHASHILLRQKSDAVRILAEIQEARKKEESIKYEASEKFTGHRPGMVFKKGPRGLGYYEDVVGKMYEEILLESSSAEPNELVHPEDALVILYTSGTTGLPKGAVISHRAFIARVSVFCSDYGMSREDTFVAWAPMFHMASTDLAIGMMLIGGKVIIVDGFNLVRLGEIIASERLGWLVLMPGVTDRLITHIKAKEITTETILMVGAMADLLPPGQVKEISRLLSCPFLNSFGSTETGIPPCSADLLYPDDSSLSLSKRQNSFCAVKLVDEDDNEVPVFENWARSLPQFPETKLQMFAKFAHRPERAPRPTLARRGDARFFRRWLARVHSLGIPPWWRR